MTNVEQQVDLSVRVAAPPAIVFPFLTDPNKMIRWFGIEATLEPKAGGAYRVNVTGSDIASGEFVEVVPNERVVFTFGWEGPDQHVPSGSSTVEISVAPDGDGSVVRLVHRDLRGSEAQHSEGWKHYLERLEIAGAGGDPGRDPWIKSAA